MPPEPLTSRLALPFLPALVPGVSCGRVMTVMSTAAAVAASLALYITASGQKDFCLKEGMAWGEQNIMKLKC